MRKSKKFISVMMAMTMAAVMAVPAQVVGLNPEAKTVYAAEETTEKPADIAQGKCGDSATYKYDGATKTLTISGTGAIWDDYGFTKNLQDTKKVVIEKGIVTLGAYSFADLWNVTEISIADTVTTIKKCAIPFINGTVEIPKSVTKVEKWGLGGAKKYIMKGDVKGYDVSAIDSVEFIDEIVLCGSAEDLGKALIHDGDDVSVTITISQDNTKCKVGNGCILSEDGKELYYYAGERDEVVIPDSVERVRTASFGYAYINKLVLGQNVTTIDDFALNGILSITKLEVNDKLSNVGVKAFWDTKIKNVTLKGKVKLGVAAFNDRTKIKYAKKFKTSQTSVTRAQVGKSKYSIKFAKISGASGYQIRVKKGKKTYKYTTTKNYYTKKAPAKLTKDYSAKKDYSIEDAYTQVEDAAYVTVRPYKKVKNKTTYGRWSAKTVLSYKK